MTAQSGFRPSSRTRAYMNGDCGEQMARRQLTMLHEPRRSYSPAERIIRARRGRVGNLIEPAFANGRDGGVVS